MNTLTIPAKPTVFDGVQYRSRLEAGWAVYWDHLEKNPSPGCTLQVIYETHELEEMLSKGSSDSVRKYRPDFLILDRTIDDGSHFLFCQEVKPIWPNEDYLEMLREVAYLLGRSHLTIPLFLTVGGFRDNKPPSVHLFPYCNWSHRAGTFIGLQVGVALEEVEAAVERASNLRWDLYRGKCK